MFYSYDLICLGHYGMDSKFVLQTPMVKDRSVFVCVCVSVCVHLLVCLFFQY